MNKLTPKQETFVREYLVDLNATAAYKRAGYKAQGRSAENAASRLLGNVGVAAAIAAAQQARAERVQLNADEVLAELRLIARSDIGDILDFSGDVPRLRPARDIAERARRAIAGVKVRRYLEGSGAAAREVEVVEFKLWNKPDALAKAMQHLGLLKEVHEHTFPQGIPVTPEDAEAGRRRVEEHRRQRLAGANVHTSGTTDGGGVSG